MAAPQKVSFTVRRPTPVSRAASSGPDSDNPSFKVPPLPRHLAPSAETTPLASPLTRSETNSPYTNGYDDSSDEDDTLQDELVTGFDRFGVQRCVLSSPPWSQLFQLTEAVAEHSRLYRLHEDKKKKEEPLVIPALKNKDWRELARKRRSAQQYVPISANAQTGADGSVGGLGTRDMIGSGPVLSGLQLRKKVVEVEVQEESATQVVVKEDDEMEEAELSEDEIARRAILAGGGLKSEGPTIDVIPTTVSEGDAYKQDVEELPEGASLEDYARVPVEQFGAAMLRGMGWKEGTAASKNGKGMVQPYLPVARPALLGIGAKEMEVFDDGSKKKKGPIRPERKYIPLVKKERDREDTPGSGRERSRSPRRSSSRRNSPSATENKNRNDHRRDENYDRKRNRDWEWDQERELREKDRDREKDRRKDKYREKERDKGRSYRNDDRRDKDRRRGYEGGYSDRGDHSRDSSRRRDY